MTADDAPGGRDGEDAGSTVDRGEDADSTATDGDSTIADDWDAIFWDVGGVILDIESVQAGHRRFVDRLLDEHDLDVDPDEALDTWRKTVGRHFREREGTEFTPAREGYAKAVEAIVDEPLPEEEWRPAFRETIEALAETDCHLGVVSDADRDELLFILEEFGVRERFDSLTISEDVGRTKPDPAMFEAALAAADADPERCVMIGDRYRHDMAGADAFGMTTVAHGVEGGEAERERGLGDESGDAVDYWIEDDLTELLEILRGERD